MQVRPLSIAALCHSVGATAFTTPGAGGSAVPPIKDAIANGELFRAHAFEYTCQPEEIGVRSPLLGYLWCRRRAAARRHRCVSISAFSDCSTNVQAPT